MLRMLIGLVAGWIAGANGTDLAVADDGREPCHLTIVVPEQWQREATRYARARAPVVTAEVVTLESIVRDGQGRDEAEKIKRFLYARWQAKQLTHVLLIGDCSLLPVRYMVLDRATPAAHDYAFYPSDLYYADLARRDGSFDDWNGAAEDFHAAYYGEVRGEKNKSDPINFDSIDYRPEIAVGRWPVQTPEQIAIAIQKSLAFERQVRKGRHPGAGRAALFSVGGWVDSRPQFDRIGERMAGWALVRRYYADAGRDDGTGTPDSAAVQATIGEGVGVLFHAGHGDQSSWQHCVGGPQLEQIESAGRWPILISAGCSTAVFAPQAPYDAYLDIHGSLHEGTNAGEVFSAPPPPPACQQPTHLDPSSMGEHLVVGTEHGAVAYIGCATGSQPCALSLLDGFAQAIGAAPAELTLGDAWRSAVEHYYTAERLEQLTPSESWYPPSIFFQGMKFVLFGDPSLPIPQAASPANR